MAPSFRAEPDNEQAERGGHLESHSSVRLAQEADSGIEP